MIGPNLGPDALILAAILLLSAGPAAAQPPLSQLTIVAPAAPGGGWDQLAREMQRELERQELAESVQVENVPGAAGTIGLAQFVNSRRGDGSALLVNGLVMLGAILWNESPVSLSQATPIARLTGEYEVIAVPAASPHRDMQSLVRALRENPAAVSWGGGSAGGTDHILAGLIVAAAEVDPRRTNYIAFSGGGEAVTALLGGQVTAGISGYSEFAPHVATGGVRLLAISAPARIASVSAPTLREQGLDVELENWRAVMAPPGLAQSDRRTLTAVVERMAHSESWRATLNRFGWSDSYLSGSELDRFLDAERVRIARIVSRLRGPAGESGAARIGEWVFPSLVLAGCAFVLVLMVFWKPVSGTAGPASTKSRIALGRMAIGLVSFVALLNPVGFIAAGAALYVWTTSAFGSRRSLRDALVGIGFCGAIYAAFTYGLGVRLP
ncbi:MAG TPA: tripartite tricarboxylate transporter substrate-binding protein [Vicinamibacterales bacterium]|nr:tripartite tricarboxylate transporter substrate-binding protein [Vicinamibacterales bacterium]